MGDLVALTKDKLENGLRRYDVNEYGIVDYVEDGVAKILITVPCDSDPVVGESNEFYDFFDWFEVMFSDPDGVQRNFQMDIVIVVNASEV